MDERILEPLGLDPFETKVYLILLDSTGLSAKDLSENYVSMSASKLYAALRRLSELDLIDGDDGRPQIFRAKDPSVTLTALRESIVERLEDKTEDTIKDLTDRFYAQVDEGMCLLRAAFSVITDQAKIIPYLKKILKEAKEEVLITKIPVFIIDAIAAILKELKSKGIDVTIVIGRNQATWSENFSGLEILVADWPDFLAQLDGVSAAMSGIGIDNFRYIGIISSHDYRKTHLSSFISPQLITVQREEILRYRPKDRLVTL